MQLDVCLSLYWHLWSVATSIQQISHQVWELCLHDWYPHLITCDENRVVNITPWIVFYQDLLNTHNVLACPLYFAPDSSRWLWSADWSPRALPSRHNPGRRPQGPLVRAAVSVSDRQNYWEYSQLLPRPTSMLPTFVITAVMKHPQLHQQL